MSIIINNVQSLSGNRIVKADGSVIKIQSGKNVSVVNGKFFIDGVPLEEYEKNTGDVINIVVHVHGNCEHVEGCDEVHIEGDCHKVRTHNGNVHVGGNVTSDVSTHNGNITCGNVGGDVDTHNGNISYRR